MNTIILQNNILFYLLPFGLALMCSLVFTPLVKSFAFKNGITDEPGEDRKIHRISMPLLGGWAVILSFLISALVAWGLGWLTDTRITDNHILAVFIGTCIIAVGGFLDDRYNLKPSLQFIWPALAALCVVLFGIQVGYVTNPFEAGTGPYGRSLLYIAPALSAVVSFLWLMGVMYTVKFLDGLDGLVAGIGAIGAIILFVVSLFWDVALSGTSIIALILAGSLLGFLPYNWHPAKIFLGESSLFIGFALGVLSIISGAKIATTLLIIGIPVLDVVWVIFRRIVKEKRSPFKSDRKHLHHRLFDAGLSQRQVVLVYCLLTALFGVSSIFLQSQQKVIALAILVVFMVLLACVLLRRSKRVIS